MRLGGALAILLVGSGCFPQGRRALRTGESITRHYETTPIPSASRRAVMDAVTSLPQPFLFGPSMGCLSTDTPCLVTQPPRIDGPVDFCLMWGSEVTCHWIEEAPGGGFVRRAGVQQAFKTIKGAPVRLPPSETERWLYQKLDLSFSEVRTIAESTADAEIAKAEEAPRNESSFWVQTRAVLSVPVFTLGVQAQGGYRRWLSEYVLLAVGGGYEHTVTTPTVAADPRHAVLVTMRFDLSSFDGLALNKRGFHLPVLSAYFGLTGVVGVSPTATWGMRSFVGFSSIVPLSFELGVAVNAWPGFTSANLYLGAGLGL